MTLTIAILSYLLALSVVIIVCLANLHTHRDLGRLAIPSLFIFLGVFLFLFSFPILFVIQQ